MNIDEVKELMHEFDVSTLREFSWNNGTDALSFSKNTTHLPTAAAPIVVAEQIGASPLLSQEEVVEVAASAQDLELETVQAEGEAVTSPLVGVVYMKPAPDKADFVQVGDTVKKGQTLLIIEAMKVMNEITAPSDGIITEILVSSDEVVEFGQELVRIKE